jgi:hypothetical protein
MEGSVLGQNTLLLRKKIHTFPHFFAIVLLARIILKSLSKTQIKTSAGIF